MADRAGPTGETLPHTSCGMSACATPFSTPSALPCVPNALAPLLPRRKLNLGNVLEPTSLSHEEAWLGLPWIVSASQFVAVAAALEAWISTTGGYQQG